MQTDPAFTMPIAMGEIIRDVIETVAHRLGDSPARQMARRQTTAATIMAFRPADPVETMLAGQCVIFDHLLRDGAHDTLGLQQPELKVRAIPQILATGKMFLAHLARLEQMQSRAAGRLAAKTPAELVTSPAAEASVRRNQAASAPADDAGQRADSKTAAHATGEAAAETPVDPTGQRAEGKTARHATGEAAAGTPADPTRQATNAGIESAEEQPAAGHSEGHPAQEQPAAAETAEAAPSGGPGILHAHPNMPPDHPAPGPLSPDHAAGSQRTQTSGTGGRDDAVARLAASLAVPVPPRPGDRTVPDRQPMAEDLV